MGQELAERYPVARAIFDEADSILGFPLASLMWDGPDAELNDTVNTQPALFALEPHYIRPSEAEVKFPHGLGPGAVKGPA